MNEGRAGAWAAGGGDCSCAANAEAAAGMRAGIGGRAAPLGAAVAHGERREVTGRDAGTVVRHCRRQLHCVKEHGHAACPSVDAVGAQLLHRLRKTLHAVAALHAQGCGLRQLPDGLLLLWLLLRLLLLSTLHLCWLWLQQSALLQPWPAGPCGCRTVAQEPTHK